MLLNNKSSSFISILNRSIEIILSNHFIAFVHWESSFSKAKYL